MFRPVCGVLLSLACQTLVWGAVKAEIKVEKLDEPPTGLSAEVAATLHTTGYRVHDADGVVCDVWLTKSLPMKPKFKTSLRVKYPLQLGALVGAIRYPEGSKPSDFRGQPLKPGLYTLRYGLQPDDGNHLGTSDIRDFLVGCPIEKDVNPARVDDLKKLFKLSQGASGTTHPAIYLLTPPPEKVTEQPTGSYDEEKKQTIFESSVLLKEGETETPWPVRMVVQGKSEG
ncbi:MAG: hypothetical protein ACK5HA_20910 [Planctomycetaceae bacterium]|jgi:hypothetical protein